MAILLKGEGANAPRVILADGEHTLGSASDAAYRLSHRTVSRRHARIEVHGDRAVVIDLGSSNGCFVDGKRVVEAPITLGQELRLGDLRLTVCAAKSADAEIALGLDLPKPTAPASTLPPGAGDRFTIHELPILLERLADGISEAELMRAFGAALCSVRGVGAVRISRAQRVYFDSGDTAGSWTTDLAGGITVSLLTLAGTVAQQFEPLLALLAPLRQLCVHHDGSQPAERELRPGPPPASLDPAVDEIYQRASRAAASKLSILIRGESGTGKEVLARFVHENSGRSGALVALNCAAIPAGLLEAELLGIEKGVATGVEARPGCFRRADGGTLFLDEIGDMPLDVQAKILRALQEKEVHPVGGKAPIAVDVRVIAATNRNLNEMISNDQFRADLRHRIADWEVVLPPLRERPADIGNLALHFLARELANHKRHARGITAEALRCLIGYQWPGNIRELEREMARCAVFLDDGAALSSDLLKVEITQAETAATTLEEQLARQERKVIAATLALHDHNASRAATALGIARSTLYRRMQALGMSTGND